MPDFLRFRDSTGLEFDATAEHYAVRPDWELIDDEPVQIQRDPVRPERAGKRSKSSVEAPTEPAEQESITTEGEPR